jgi:hypothetical protein
LETRYEERELSAESGTRVPRGQTILAVRSKISGSDKSAASAQPVPAVFDSQPFFPGAFIRKLQAAFCSL